ncbi:MAG: hypothetical protein KGI28_01600 [Thaumarchaeota archaeon]|nr:hypothetical protein [Nitrososphaerota archaeon]
MDTNGYLIEMLANAIIGFFFGPVIDNILGLIILIVIAGAAVFLVGQAIMDPTSFSTAITNLTNFVTFAFGFIPSLVIGGVGTSIGVGIRKTVNSIF